MNKVIGIINITDEAVANTTIFFLKEYLLYTIHNNLETSRIIIDNITTLEDKSTAYSNKIKCDNIVNSLGRALETLIEAKSDVVAILCNVAHIYIEQLLMLYPHIKPYFIDVVRGTVANIVNEHIMDILILCSENARKSKLFETYFEGTGVCISYAEAEQDEIHFLMAAVENNQVNDSAVFKLYQICSKYRKHNIYFACTELSLIYGNNRTVFNEFRIVDTIDSVIHQLCQKIVD